jgi:hypothetical protein
LFGGLQAKRLNKRSGHHSTNGPYDWSSQAIRCGTRNFDAQKVLHYNTNHIEVDFLLFVVELSRIECATPEK